MAKKQQKPKPGPDPERLKIEGDPQEALRKLISAKPPKADDDEQEEAEQPDEPPRGD